MNEIEFDNGISDQLSNLSTTQLTFAHLQTEL